MSKISVWALSGSDDTKSTLRGEGNLVLIRNRYKENWVVAVDAGLRSGAEIAAILAALQVHTLILTHDDNDHIGGALHVLKESKEPVSEIWVPAYWMMQNSILRRLADSAGSTPDEAEMSVVTELAAAAISTGPEWLSADTFSSAFEMTDASEPDSLSDELPIADYQETSTMDDMLGAFSELSARGTPPSRMMRSGLTHLWQGTASREMAKRTLQRIGKINRILLEAQRRGTLIRSFLPAESSNPRPNSSVAWQTQGEPGSLTILNARQVHIGNPKVFSRAALSMSLAAVTGLSVQNRTALVPFVWPTGGSSADGFIIWSDSSGQWTSAPQFTVPWEHVGGMTAPHHGSDNAAHDSIWNEMASANVAKGRNMSVIVSGDLRKTQGSTTRSRAVKSRLDAAQPIAYGVVHCLDASDSRSPRRQVLYRSSNPSCVPDGQVSWLHSFPPVICGTDCIGCHQNG